MRTALNRSSILMTTLLPATLALTGIALGSGSFTPAQAVCAPILSGSTAVPGADHSCGIYPGQPDLAAINAVSNKNYVFFAKSENNATIPNDGRGFLFIPYTLTYDGGAPSTSGTYELNPDYVWSGIQWAFALKGGSNWALYEFDVNSGQTSGTWSMSDLPTGGSNPPELSNFIFVVTDLPPVEDVPEPLTLLGPATAVGLGTFFKRRRNQKQS